MSKSFDEKAEYLAHLIVDSVLVVLLAKENEDTLGEFMAAVRANPASPFDAVKGYTRDWVHALYEEYKGM